MDILKGPSGGSPPTGSKEWTPKRKKRIRKVDISLPKDFVHVSTVKHRKKVSIDFSDPVIQSFLQQAEVNVKDLCNPEISRVVTNFIEKVGLDAIRHESEKSGLPFQHDGILSQMPIAEEGNLLAPDLKDSFDSTAKSADEKSLIFCPEHDIEITSEMDDVFTSQVDTSVPDIGSENVEGEIDSRKTRESDTSVEGNKIDHDTFLCELKAAIRKREIRMKLQLQKEEKCGEDIWSELRPAVKTKRRVSFFEPEKSPSPKPMRTVHTRWDLTDDSSDITDVGVSKMKDGGVKHTDEMVHCDDADGFDGNSTFECSVNTAGKPKLPLMGETKALNKVLSFNDSNESNMLHDEDQAISWLNTAHSPLSSDQHQHDGFSTVRLKSEDESVFLESESPLMEVSLARKEETIVIKGTDEEIKMEIPSKNSLEGKRTNKKGGIAQWLFGKRNPECPQKVCDSSGILEEATGKVKNEVTESKVTRSPEKLRNSGKRKGVKGRGNKLMAPPRQEQKLGDEQGEFHTVSLKDITNLETSRKKDSKTSFAIFMGKKKASVANVAEEELPKSSDNATNRNADEENKDCDEKVSVSSSNLNSHSKRETSGVKKRRIAVKKKDIQVVHHLMRDMRHVTHITWDSESHNFLINHTDDEELRKVLLQDKLCVELPRYKQRRNSYSMAVDGIDSEYEKCLSKPGERRSFSLSSASRVFSRGENKRVPLPRPKSDLPTHENVIYF